MHNTYNQNEVESGNNTESFPDKGLAYIGYAVHTLAFAIVVAGVAIGVALAEGTAQICIGILGVAIIVGMAQDLFMSDKEKKFYGFFIKPEEDDLEQAIMEAEKGNQG